MRAFFLFFFSRGFPYRFSLRREGRAKYHFYFCDEPFLPATFSSSDLLAGFIELLLFALYPGYVISFFNSLKTNHFFFYRVGCVTVVKTTDVHARRVRTVFRCPHYELFLAFCGYRVLSVVGNLAICVLDRREQKLFGCPIFSFVVERWNFRRVARTF